MVQGFHTLPEITSHSLGITGQGLRVPTAGPWLTLATSCLLWSHPSLPPFQVQLPETEECSHTDPEALAGSLL